MGALHIACTTHPSGPCDPSSQLPHIARRPPQIVTSLWFTPLLHGVATFLYFLSWVVYAGTMNSNFNGANFLFTFLLAERYVGE